MAPLVLALLVNTGCSAGSPAERTIVPTEVSFAEMFRLVQEITPEQSPESPIALVSGASWDDAHIAIADVSESNVKLFDSQGSRLATVGRRGEGPGEFLQPRYPQLMGGHLFVADAGLGRVSVWTSAGDLDRQIETGIGYVSDFAVTPDGRLVFAGAGFGDSQSAMGVYAADGTLLAHGLGTNDVLPADADPDLPWRNMRQTFFAVANDTAWAVSTISDSIWAVPLNREDLQPESHRLAIPGYVAPAPPENPLRSPRDLMEWGNSFHAAAPPVASTELLAIPFVRGVLNNGDPTILVVRDQSGDWYALSDAPPVIAMSSERLLVIHNPLEEQVRFAIYEKRPGLFANSCQRG